MRTMRSVIDLLKSSLLFLEFNFFHSVSHSPLFVLRNKCEIMFIVNCECYFVENGLFFLLLSDFLSDWRWFSMVLLHNLSCGFMHFLWTNFNCSTLFKTFVTQIFYCYWSNMDLIFVNIYTQFTLTLKWFCSM